MVLKLTYQTEVKDLMLATILYFNTVNKNTYDHFNTSYKGNYSNKEYKLNVDDENDDISEAASDYDEEHGKKLQPADIELC